jgi:hypothetical protein
VVICQSDSDCILEDGAVGSGSCVCSLRRDGLAICNPDISSDAFQGYWESCGNDNTITSVDEYNYWAYYMQIWVFLQTDLECIKRLYEIEQLTTLYDLYANSATILVLSTLLY